MDTQINVAVTVNVPAGVSAPEAQAIVDVVTALDELADATVNVAVMQTDTASTA